MKIIDKIRESLNSEGEKGVTELADQFFVSKQAVHSALNQLLENGEIEKLGRTPKTIYRIAKVQKPLIFDSVNQDDDEYLRNQFLVITELGKMLDGAEGFAHWCKQRDLPLQKTIEEFKKTKAKYESYYNEMGIINGMEKLSNTKGFDEIFLNDIYYLDFYAIERFGKTRLGTLLHYAKQGQNKFLMKILVDEIRERIKILVQENDFDAIGYVPPTIRREVQLMKFMETQLKINLPKINIQKISGIIPVPQKSLNKFEERINNAENTFAISEKVKYKHILLIDDAVGSGTTLNQIAGKIKRKGIAEKITGLAIVGSFKGFDVVTDV
jgi:hypothetical protein